MPSMKKLYIYSCTPSQRLPGPQALSVRVFQHAVKVHVGVDTVAHAGHIDLDLGGGEAF